MADHDEEPATPSQINRMIRQRIARHPEVEEMGINIYPMMDMMTILLVFLIMSFAQSSAAAVVESKELEIPRSTAEIDVEPCLNITISASEIVVEGKQVLSLRNGQIDPSQKQGGTTGFLVSPLLKNLQAHRDRLKLIAQRNTKKPFQGDVQIVADRRTPYRTLIDIIYTMGQSEFKAMRFVVMKAEQPG